MSNLNLSKKALALRASHQGIITAALASFPEDRLPELGIKGKKLEKIVKDLALDRDDLDNLLTCRLEFEAGWSYMVKLITELDLSTAEVTNLYRAQKLIEDQLSGVKKEDKRTISLVELYKFYRHFGNGELGEDGSEESLATLFVETHQEMSRIFDFKATWTNVTVAMLINAKKTFDTDNIEQLMECIKEDRDVPSNDNGFSSSIGYESSRQRAVVGWNEHPVPRLVLGPVERPNTTESTEEQSTVSTKKARRKFPRRLWTAFRHV
jgi:hypothetical protein